MHNISKIISVILTMVIFSTCLSSCANIGSSKSKPVIVATIYPIYDWIRTILGNSIKDVDLILLESGSADLHNYKPSAEDIITLGKADIFFYIGGESDEWVDSAITSAQLPENKAINLLQSLGTLAKEEKPIEGATESEAEEEEEEEGAADEHIWLSLNNAIHLIPIMAEKIKTAIPGISKSIEDNTDKFVNELSSLHQQYTESLSAKKRDTVIFASRFPFRYLMDDYDIKYYAAFSGCSAETEASFETVAFLANKIKETTAQYIIILEESDTKLAETIINESGNEKVKILTLNSMQSVDANTTNNTYYNHMKNNLMTLAIILGGETINVN